ncbi:MAG TPA: hypothetical protein VFE60_24745 [Roseiarcus sp.]|jgi:hypothetical protein|nr:hypothetical protein [Roseiarcus sp.]
MRQITLSVPLEVKPESCSSLSTLIDALKQREDKGVNPAAANFDRIIRLIPSLHFMSMSVFPAANYDPLFILEANFDGLPGPFWGQMEAVLGEDLRAMLRCCKQPMDGDGALYDAVTAERSRAPVAPYMEARTQRPSVFHHGNRGLARDRILGDYALFKDLCAELDMQPSPGGKNYYDLSPVSIHAALRAAMLPRYGWLDEPEPKRITQAENLTDWARAIAFGLTALIALSAPGLLLAALVPWRTDVVIMVVAAAALFGLTSLDRRGRQGAEIATHFNAGTFLIGQLPKFLIAAAIYVVGASVLADLAIALASFALSLIGIGSYLSPAAALLPAVHMVVLGLFSLLLITLPALVFLLRWNENRDSSQDAPPANEGAVREMLQREDWVTQNHMGSIVLIRPGILRTVIIRAGHLGLGLLLRLIARDGYLGSMRTVHFAHWAFLNNSGRLLFFSNFDHSWGSYLDDFIEKAHPGLTLAWGCGVGFPPTRFLILDGASHGRLFKSWALASRTVSRFWYSAYPDLTVDQIERNNRIANGLRKTSLQDKEAVAWMQDL